MYYSVCDFYGRSSQYVCSGACFGLGPSAVCRVNMYLTYTTCTGIWSTDFVRYYVVYNASFRPFILSGMWIKSSLDNLCGVSR